MKTDLGTTEMLRTSVVLVLVFLAFGGLMVWNPGRSYWEEVGPRWDKMFNPVNYND